MAAEGFSWYLILVVCVVFVLVVLSNVYIIVEYGHPEDKNQAWIPKIVVLLSLTVAEVSVLLFPLDVANTGACNTNISPSSCHYTLPMTQLWWGLFIANLVLVFCVIPFTLFLYEADSDFTLFQKIKSAVFWTLGFLTFIIVIIVIAYFLGGYVEYPTQQVTSGTASMDILIDLALQTTQCILPIYQNTTGPGKDGQCDAFTTPYVYSTWKLRVSLPTYIMAIQSVLGWVLFMVFAGVGMFGAPIDWIKQWVYRPKGVITKSEYMKRARVIAQRAKEIMNLAQMMRRGERDRRWRSNYKKLQTELLQIEDDEYQLERVFPQGEDGDVKWVLYMLSFWVTGFVGVLGLIVSTAWIVHIAIYMLPPTPIYGFLNEFFTMLDDAFALLGVIAFSFFCLYLLVISMKGNFLLGLNFVFVNLYPVKPGATMMSSFLVNSAIILLMSPAILQFCATAFPIYATGTSIFDVFGNQVSYLQGIKYIYNLNIFLYCLLSISVLSALFMAIKGRKQWKRRGKYDAYLED